METKLTKSKNLRGGYGVLILNFSESSRCWWLWPTITLWIQDYLIVLMRRQVYVFKIISCYYLDGRGKRALIASFWLRDTLCVHHILPKRNLVNCWLKDIFMPLHCGVYSSLLDMKHFQLKASWKCCFRFSLWRIILQVAFYCFTYWSHS